MKYVEFVNQALKAKLQSGPKSVLYGQNIAAGSCLGGLTRGINSTDSLRVINTTNTENGLFGLGFGLMLAGVNAVFAMKQHDFMLLGIDQMTNSHYGIQNRKLTAGFTVLTVVVDSGFEGPQAALNNLGEIASIARIPCITVNSVPEIEWAINTQLMAPGPRILAVSQRLYHTPVLTQDGAKEAAPGVFKHSAGGDVTIASYNFTLPQTVNLIETLKAKGVSADLFTVADMAGATLAPVFESAQKTKKLLVIDDTKTHMPPSYVLMDANNASLAGVKRVYVRRTVDDNWYAPNADTFVLNHDDIVRQLGV